MKTTLDGADAGGKVNMKTWQQELRGRNTEDKGGESVAVGELGGPHVLLTHGRRRGRGQGQDV